MCNFVTKLGIILDTCKTFEPKQVSHCSQQSLPDIFIGCGSEDEYSGILEEKKFSYGNFRTILKDAGGTDVNEDIYWGDPRDDSQTRNYWVYDFSDSYFKKLTSTDKKAHLRATYVIIK